MSIAQTIMQQLGGNKFVAMTGASSISAGTHSVSFRIGRNPKGVRGVVIELRSNDLYEMTFKTMKGFEPVVLSAVTDVYCDQLQERFTEHTGMLTHL